MRDGGRENKDRCHASFALRGLDERQTRTHREEAEVHRVSGSAHTCTLRLFMCTFLHVKDAPGNDGDVSVVDMNMYFVCLSVHEITQTTQNTQTMGVRERRKSSI